MTKIIKNSWALFTGIGIMMIAHGLQGNLMGVRSVIEEFNFIEGGKQGEKANELMKRVDEALYKAKESGRNKVVVG